MGAKFPGTKQLPSSFGSLGVSETSAPESSKPTQNTSLFTRSSTSDELLPSSAAPPAIAPVNIFANFAQKDSQPSKDSAQVTQSASLASSQAPLKPFTFPKLGELSSTVTAAPSSMLAPTPSLGSTFGQPGKNETSDTKSGAFNPLFSQPQQTSSASAAQTNATTSQSLGSSIFTQPSIPQPNQTLQSQEEALQPNLGLGRASQPVYFDNLLEKGKKKANALNTDSGFGDLPSLQLGLGEIARKARELGGLGAQTNGGATPDSKASACESFSLIFLRKSDSGCRHYLLAASGVNPGTTRRDLNSLYAQSFGAGNRQLTTDWDPDTNKFVAQLQQQSTLKMIAEGVERAHRNFNNFLDENVDMNWELQRKKIYQHFGLVSRGNDDGGTYPNPGEKGSFGRSSKRARPSNPVKFDQSTMNKSFFLNPSLQKSVIGTPGVGTPNSNLFADVAEKADAPIKSQDDRFTRSKQAKFARIVHSLNEARLQETSFPLLEEFSSLDQEPGGEVSS